MTNRTIGVAHVCPRCRGTKRAPDGSACGHCHADGMIDAVPAPESESLGAPTPRQSVSEAWAAFERIVLDPANAAQIQRREMRRAWYAGVSWFLESLTQSLDPGAEPTANDLAYLDSVLAELDAFGERLSRGEV
jgi:hypothetical protein